MSIKDKTVITSTSDGYYGKRVETSVIQFGQDWPGVFIRGDQAFGYAMALLPLIRRAAQNGNETKINGMILSRGLFHVLVSCCEHDKLREELEGLFSPKPGEPSFESATEEQFYQMIIKVQQAVWPNHGPRTVTVQDDPPGPVQVARQIDGKTIVPDGKPIIWTLLMMPRMDGTYYPTLVRRGYELTTSEKAASAKLIEVPDDVASDDPANVLEWAYANARHLGEVAKISIRRHD